MSKHKATFEHTLLEHYNKNLEAFFECPAPTMGSLIVKEQIKESRSLLHSLNDKPDWLTDSDLDRFDEKITKSLMAVNDAAQITVLGS